MLNLAHLSILKLLPSPAWHLICGQRISGALEPTQASQSFSSTVLTRLRAGRGTVMQVRLRGTFRLLLYRAVLPRLLRAQCRLCTLLKPIILYPRVDRKRSSVTTGSLGAPLVVTVSLWHFVPVRMVGAICICLPHSPRICDCLCVGVHIKFI